jgi:hypothetical protein
MELNEFIKDTLLGIYNGIQEANVAIMEKQGKTMGQDGGATFGMETRHTGPKDSSISFDVAVTVSKGSQATGGGRVNVVIADLGAETKGERKEESVSRIKFQVTPNTFIG